MNVLNGQTEAFEVYRYLGQDGQSTRPQVLLEHVATVWDHEEARKLDLLVSGSRESRRFDVKQLETISKIGVIVVDEEVFYDSGKPPIPTCLVSATAAEALELYALTYLSSSTVQRDC